MKKIGSFWSFFLNISMRLSELKEECCGPWKEGLWGVGLCILIGLRLYVYM